MTNRKLGNDKVDGSFFYLRKDLKLIKNRKTGEIKGEVSLTIFEAMKIRLAMIKCNLSHPC